MIGKGVVRGSLDVQPASSVRIGQAGMPQVLPGGRVLVEDFQPYSVGALGSSPNSTGGVWTGVPDGTANAEIVNDAGNKALSVRGLNTTSDTWRPARHRPRRHTPGDVSLGANDVGTYFSGSEGR